MNRNVSCLVCIALWGLSTLGFAGDRPEPGVQPSSPQQDALEAEEEAAEDEVMPAPSYPEHTFRLYSQRDVDLRARPNVGLRVPPLHSMISPRTADFYDRDREYELPLYSVSTSLDVLSIDGGRSSAKAQEFRDWDDQVAVGVDAQVRTDKTWFRLTGRHLLLDDQDLRLELRRFGMFSARLNYSQIPHNYAFDASSIYSGIGTGLLQIDDATQQYLQDSLSPVDAAIRLKEIVSGASLVDLGHRRDRTAIEIDLTAFDPLAIELVARHESRKGTRPWSASFGLKNVVEIPWPVSYETRELRLKAEYRLANGLLSGEYRVSEFDNDIGAVAFDNPWRLTDSAPFSAITSTYEDGPASGLIDLYPNNRQYEFTLTFVKNQLPGRSNFFAVVSRGRLEQNDALLPYTTNTAIVPGAAGRPPFDATVLANVPGLSAAAELDTQLVHLRWTSQPTDRLRIKAELRDFEMENESAVIHFPGIAVEDTFWRGFGRDALATNLPIEHAKTELGLDLSFSLNQGVQLILGYENEVIDREYREVAKSKEDRFEISLDAKPAPYMDLKVSYLVSQRRAEEYDFDQFFRNQGMEFIPVLSFLRKFDQANRDRERLQVIANFFPTETLIVGAQVIVGRDDYPDSSFGVLDEKHQVYAMDVSWMPSGRFSIFASYSFEQYDVGIAGREWIAFGPGDPFRTEPGLDSPSNWSADTEDEVDSVAIGSVFQLIPEKLLLDISFTYSKSDGRIAYASPVGEIDNSPFELADLEEVDDVTWYNVNPELSYTISENLSLSLAYMKESYEIQDFNLDGFELVPTTIDGEFNSALFMGTFPTDFDIEVFYLELKVGF